MKKILALLLVMISLVGCTENIHVEQYSHDKLGTATLRIDFNSLNYTLTLEKDNMIAREENTATVNYNYDWQVSVIECVVNSTQLFPNFLYSYWAVFNYDTKDLILFVVNDARLFVDDSILQ